MTKELCGAKHPKTGIRCQHEVGPHTIHHGTNDNGKFVMWTTGLRTGI